MAIQPVTMDKVSHVTPTPAVTNVTGNSDTKNIQTQITSKQQHLKQISSDDTITATEKEEKRRELQKEIDELTRKLELKKQEQKEKSEEAAKKQEKMAALKAEMFKEASSTIEPREATAPLASKEHETGKATEARYEAEKTDTQKEEQKKADMSIKEIQQMLSADYLLQKDLVQEQVDQQTEHTINVMEAEINQDKLYGADTTKKEASLDSLRNKENFWSDAQQTQESQKQNSEQNHSQTVINANAKVIIDHI